MSGSIDHITQEVPISFWRKQLRFFPQASAVAVRGEGEEWLGSVEKLSQTQLGLFGFWIYLSICVFVCLFDY